VVGQKCRPQIEEAPTSRRGVLGLQVSQDSTRGQQWDKTFEVFYPIKKMQGTGGKCMPR